MRITYTTPGTRWAGSSKISEERIREACQNPTRLWITPPSRLWGGTQLQAYVYHWKDADDIVFIGGEVLSGRVGSNPSDIDHIGVEVALRLRSQLPAGAISPHSTINEVLTLVGRSFGESVTLHPHYLPAKVYAGPVDPQYLQNALSVSYDPDDLMHSMSSEGGQATLFFMARRSTHERWLSSSRRPTQIERPAVWRAVADEIGHDKSRVADAATVIEAMADEFEALIESEGAREEVLHQWLKDERHHLFLDPDAVQVWSKLKFGCQVSDFVIRRFDDTYRLIEIEPATTPIFREGNWEFSAPFTHACQQVQDWQRYIRTNVLTVRDSQGLTGIDQPSGVVIVGRSQMLGSRDAEARWRDRKATDPVPYTYDEIVRRARVLAINVRRSG